jgi:hypothetical protein
MKILIERCRDLNVEFEVMIIHSRCFFNDEYCFSWHSGECDSLCSYFEEVSKKVEKNFPHSWKQTIEKILNAPHSQFEEGSPLDRFLKTRTLYLKASEGYSLKSEENSGNEKKGLHPDLASIVFKNCGLCAIKQLKEMGVSVVKVPARGDQEKIKYLQLVSRVVKHPNPTKEFCKSLINSPGFCVRTGRCYYYIGN